MTTTVSYLDTESVPRTDAETQFLWELGKIDEDISDLVARRTVVLKALAQERQRRIAKTSVTAKRGRQCVLIQIEVLSALRLAEAVTLSGDELLNRVKLSEPNLNASTFRSVLRRMKAKKLIMASPGRRGVWTLSPAGSQ